MKKLTAIAGVLVLAGCTMIPKYERPVAPVPNEFPYGAATTGVAPAQFAWEQFFADPQLRSLIATALETVLFAISSV